MGGRVAQWVAIRYPDRVRHLVLGCTSPGGSHSIGPDRSIDEALAVADPKAIETALLDLMYASDPPTTSQLLGDPNMPAYARRRHRIASRRHDAWDHLPHIQARTLVIHGTADRFTPAANASLLAERIPQAHLHLIDQARHAYFEEFRHVASPRVLTFSPQREAAFRPAVSVVLGEQPGLPARTDVSSGARSQMRSLKIVALAAAGRPQRLVVAHRRTRQAMRCQDQWMRASSRSD